MVKVVVGLSHDPNKQVDAKGLLRENKHENIFI